MTTGILMTYLSETIALDKPTLDFIVNTLRKEWYALNDLDDVARSQNESARDVGLRVGRKSQLNKTIRDIATLRDAL